MHTLETVASEIPAIDPPHEKCNFINKNIILGSHPVELTLKKLEDYGVEIFIDLREQTNYNTQKQKYHFPILRGSAPSKKQATEILQIILNNPNKLIYIHCNGGYGRAGTIGAYILGKIYGLDVTESVTHIEKCKNTRIDKSKNFIPSPEMPRQIKFLQKELGLKYGNIIPDRNDKSWLKLI